MSLRMFLHRQVERLEREKVAGRIKDNRSHNTDPLQQLGLPAIGAGKAPHIARHPLANPRSAASSQERITNPSSHG